MRPQLGYYHSLIEEAVVLGRADGEPGQQSPFRGRQQTRRIIFRHRRKLLRLNGSFIDGDSDETHEFFMRLFQTRSFRFAQLHAWLQQSVRPLPRS